MEPAHDRPVGSRIAFGTMLALMMGTGTYAGYAFGVLAPDFRATFGLSRFELGLLTTAFFLVGGTLSLVAGPATDRLGARRVMFVALVASAAALAGMALAPAYAVLLAMAALAGVALAAGNPVTNKLVAVHIAPGERGLIMGGKQSGVQVGAFAAGALLAPLAVAVGWRAALAGSALLPLGAILLALAVIPADRRQVRDAPPTEAPGPLPRGVFWLTAYAFLMGSGVATINAYLPLYLVERAGASLELAGTVAATIGLVGIGSRIAWGWASERLRQYSLALLMLGALAVVAVLLVAAVEVVGLWLAWPAAALFGASAVTWNAVGNLAVITSSGAARAGRATGILTFGFYIGFVGSPVLFGLLVDRGVAYGLAWLGVAGVFSATVLVIGAWRHSEARSAGRPG